MLSHDGQMVTRPAHGENNANVLLTATIKKGSVTVTKVFSMTVLAEDSDILKVAVDKAALTENAIKETNIDLAYVTGAPANPLPSSGAVNGSMITWKSSAPLIVSDDGQTVARSVYYIRLWQWQIWTK